MTKAIEHDRILSEEIGPRGSTSKSEKTAADYIKKVTSSWGIEAEEQSFSSPATFSSTYGLIYLLYLVSAAIYFYWPKYGYFISIITLILYLAEIHTIECLSRLVPQGKSKNIWTKISPSNVEINKIVISAHMDSSKSSAMFSPKMVKGWRDSFIINVISSFMIPILFGLGIIWDKIFWYLSLPFVFVIFISFVLLLHREIFYSHTHGANDNASGVGVMLELGEEFAQVPLENTSVYLLATGCEEAGLVGMLRFIKENKNALRNAYFFVLDNLGIDEIKYIIKEGMIKPYDIDKSLENISAEAARELAFENIKINPSTFTGISTDALPLLARGFKAMSVMGTAPYGLATNWHWKTDVFENIDAQRLKEAKTFVKTLCHKIDVI